MFRATLLITFLAVCAFIANAQKCALKVGAWEGYPEEITKEGGHLVTRKATITGFTATALNQKTGGLYRGVLRSGDVVFLSIPQGNYRITLRKPGFKTTVESYLFTCKNALDGFDIADILMARGKPSEIFRRGQVNSIRRLDLPVVIGDSGDNAPPIPPSPQPVPKTISGGVLNGKAVSLPKPAYPPAARAVRASGAVPVQVLIDEEGRVIAASATGGHPLLQAAAVAAARAARFPPTLLSGQPVKVSGIITYNFVP